MKKLAYLCLICLAVSFCASAKAVEEDVKQVTIFYNNIKLLMEGKQTAIKDDNGKTVEPFIMDGVVYVPARTLSDLLKSTGQYNKKYTSYFIGKPTTKPIKWVSLYEKPYLSVSNANRFRSKEVDGVQYLGGKVYNGTELPGNRYQGSWDVTYALNGVAQKVSGTICKTASSTDRYEVVYEFFDENDKLLYKSPIMTGNVAEREFEFNTGKALMLKLKITLTSRWSETECWIKDLKIYTSDY